MNAPRDFRMQVVLISLVRVPERNTFLILREAPTAKF
jgi:hypothetical protein